MRPAWRLGVGVVIALIGCGTDHLIDPSEEGERYQLVAVDGLPLPVLLDSLSIGLGGPESPWVEAAEMILRLDATARIVSRQRVTGGGQDSTRLSDYEASYVIEADSLRLCREERVGLRCLIGPVEQDAITIPGLYYGPPGANRAYRFVPE